MPRFVLLYHDCPPHYERLSHWDLMLEAGGQLSTWALAELPASWQAAHAETSILFPDCPPLARTDCVAVQRLGDHRREYLNYTGPISGDRGSVIRVAEGTYERISGVGTAATLEITVAGGLSERIRLSPTTVGCSEWSLTARSGQEGRS
jgi:hypothetical protein